MFALGMRNPSEYQGMVKGMETVVEKEVTPEPTKPETETEDSSNTEDLKTANTEKVAELKAVKEAKLIELKKLQAAKKDKYEKMLQLQKEKAAQLKEELKKKRVEAKQEYEAEREAFEAKLKTLRDEKKKQIVENIDQKMAEINKNRTDAMMDHLNKMSEILIKVEEKANATGKDTSLVTAAISDAQGAINAAKAKVTEQAGKEYVITIQSDDTLKTDVGKVISTLTADLKSVQAFVVEARQKVSAAIQALGMLFRTGKEASPSGTL